MRIARILPLIFLLACGGDTPPSDVATGLDVVDTDGADGLDSGGEADADSLEDIRLDPTEPGDTTDVSEVGVPDADALEDPDTSQDTDFGGDDDAPNDADVDEDSGTGEDTDAPEDADAVEDPDTAGDADALDAESDPDADSSEVGDVSEEPDSDVNDTAEDIDLADTSDTEDGGRDVSDTDLASDTPDVPAFECEPPLASGVPIDDPDAPHSFRDVTLAAGISGVQWAAVETFGDSPCGEASILAGGAAAADYDADGDLDLFYPRVLQTDRFYQNQGDGTFVDIAGDLGMDSMRSGNAAAWADINGDGDLDLFVSTLAGGDNHLWIQTDDGFVDEAAARGLSVNEAGDRLRDCGYMFGASFADVDGDGDLDFYLSRWIPTGRVWGSLIFENTGGGFFERRNEEWGPNPIARSVVFGSSFFDFDGDNQVELLLTADFGTSTYWEWTGSSFEESPESTGLRTDENGMGTAVGDIDGDGDLDLFVTAIYGEARIECEVSWGCTGNRLYLNSGNGQFKDCTTEYGVRDGGWGWGPSMFDADLDGDLDIGMTGGYWLHWDSESLESLRARLTRYRFGGMRLWMNGGEMPFAESSDWLSLVNPRRGRAFVPFDADRDGDLDLFVVNNMDEPVFFRNEGLESRHWLTVSLRDSTSENTHGVGATVWAKMEIESPWIRRDISASGAFLSTPVPEAHFGFGDYDGVVKVRVEWPDGEVTIVTDVGLDAQLRVER